jgi:hypothetical protein
LSSFWERQSGLLQFFEGILCHRNPAMKKKKMTNSYIQQFHDVIWISEYARGLIMACNKFIASAWQEKIALSC